MTDWVYLRPQMGLKFMYKEISHYLLNIVTSAQTLFSIIRVHPVWFYAPLGLTCALCNLRALSSRFLADILSQIEAKIAFLGHIQILNSFML